MHTQRIPDTGELESRIGYVFHDKALLNAALTHTSFVKGDGKHAVHNERLEFLGDAVLELCVSTYLYERYTAMSEGKMTRLRASLVCEPALYQAANTLGVAEYLRLGRGEESTGGREKPSIVSDALEALIGAIYLDGGLEPAKLFIGKYVISALEGSEETDIKDYKTMLQEYAQKKRLGNVQYQLVSETGPDHRKVFVMQVLLNASVIGEGEGATKQKAGQLAAKQGLISLNALG